MKFNHKHSRRIISLLRAGVRELNDMVEQHHAHSEATRRAVALMLESSDESTLQDAEMNSRIVAKFEQLGERYGPRDEQIEELRAQRDHWKRVAADNRPPTEGAARGRSEQAHEWQCLRPIDVDTIRGHHERRCLIYHDGPQMTEVCDGDAAAGLFLGIAVEDMSDRVVRWLHSPTTEDELRSLRMGDISVREVIRKSLVYVIDCDVTFGEFIGAWIVDGAKLPESVLPEVGVMLPGSRRPDCEPKADSESGAANEGPVQG